MDNKKTGMNGITEIQSSKEEENRKHQDSLRCCKELEEKIEKLIIESNMSYKEVNSVLGRLKVIYQDKGNNLLNATNIQKVIETPRFIR